MNLSSLFSDEKVNTGRQVELDIAKGLSIIFMVFLHTIMVVSIFNNSLSPAYQFIFSDILGKPCAAPIFMFCMGVGIVYSRHSQWNVMVRRGIKLMVLGLLVNVFEFLLPCFVSGQLLGRWDLFPTAGGLLLFCVDILAFAGLSFIVMGILKKFEVSDKYLIVIAVVMSLLGSFLRFTDFGTDVLNLIFGYFIGTEGGFTAFALFNWFIFPIMGIIWGKYFIRAKDKSKFFRFWPVYIIVALIYFLYSTQVSGGFLSDAHHYYFMTTLDAVFCLIYAPGNIGLCYYLSRHLPDIVNKGFSILSSNINHIYIAQWFFIPMTIIFIVYFIRDIVFTDLMVSIISIVMMVVSTVCAVYYNKFKKKYLVGDK